MNLYLALHKDRFGLHSYLVQARDTPSPGAVRRHLRLLPDARVEVKLLAEYIDEVPVIEGNPSPVSPEPASG